MKRSARRIDELRHFFLAENGGQAIAFLGIGSVGNAPGPLERLDVEEAQGAEMVGHRTGSQFVQGEELRLVLADVLRSQAIGRAVEELSEALDQAYPYGKHTVDGGREASLEIVRPVSASGSELWG